MLSMKIRSIAIALAASFSVVGGAVPAVAQAETKSSGAPTQQETCDTLYGQFEHWVNLADALYQSEGNGGTFKAVLDTAESTLHEAENAGCDWAASARPPSRTLVSATSVGTLALSSEAATSSPTKVIAPTRTALRVR